MPLCSIHRAGCWEAWRKEMDQNEYICAELVLWVILTRAKYNQTHEGAEHTDPFHLGKSVLDLGSPER